MKELISVVKILLIFFIVYGLLLISYQSYLKYYNTELGQHDPYTEMVADQSASLLNFLGIDTQKVVDSGKPYVWLYMDNKYAAMVNEGCNALSVLILYIAFILAFFTRFKPTILYLIGTLIILYLINVARVSWLSYIYRYQPEYSQTAHDIVFPAIVYGAVLVFWFIWMRFFVLKPKKNE